MEVIQVDRVREMCLNNIYSDLEKEVSINLK